MKSELFAHLICKVTQFEKTTCLRKLHNKAFHYELISIVSA
uniref:Uncharacterized protein n=1 Tax=Ascaris lumbricoides TaxID=6252 RepID=A0A0M3HLG9_ASCLU